MKKVLLFIIMILTGLHVLGQDRTTKLTVYPSYKPSIITLADGRKLNQPLTNIFLRNSSLLYLSGTITKQANIKNILSVQFDDRTYLRIDTLLAYQVDTIGDDALYCATIIDEVAYRQNIKNNHNFTDINFVSDQLGTTSVDLNGEDDFHFPLINIYYYRMNGKYVRCHERHLSRILDKEKRRIMKSHLMLQDFSWTDEKSLLNLLKGLQ